MSQSTQPVTQSPTFNTIYTHVKPHFDEAAAIAVMQLVGEQKYPGISKASVLFCRDGETVDGLDWKSHYIRGHLQIGVGGGLFDEHPTKDGTPRKVGQSACSLVVKALGLNEHPVYRKLSDYVTKSDQERTTDPFHLSNLIKCLYRMPGNNHDETFLLAVKLVKAWICQELEGFKAQALVDSILRNGQFNTVRVNIGGESKILKVTWAVCDNLKFAAMARNAGFAVVVQRNKNGLTQIFINQHHKHLMDIEAVVEAVRRAELLAQGGEESDLVGENLRQIGKTASVPNWYYMMPGDMLLNGSESAPDTEPSKLSLPGLVHTVCDNIGKKG